MTQYTLDCQAGYISTLGLHHIGQVIVGLRAQMFDYFKIRYLLYMRHDVRIFLTGFPASRPMYYKVGGIMHHKSDYRIVK